MRLRLVVALLLLIPAGFAGAGQPLAWKTGRFTVDPGEVEIYLGGSSDAEARTRIMLTKS